MFEVIIYYKYVKIENPEQLMYAQRLLCERLGIKGRILIAEEGINGTVEGTKEAIANYIQEFKKDLRFTDVYIKSNPGTGNAFPKLKIKVREEIVSGHLKDLDVDPTEVTGKYIMPEELHDWLNSSKEFYIIDMRNDFEQEVGHFEKSVFPGMENFRDLPKALPHLEHLKDKTVVTVCTYGVRCEKASGFLVKNGFKDVYQLHGGIGVYMEKYPGQHFLGKLYVFDNRITMAFNAPEPLAVVGKCAKCGASSENYTNCGFDECHKHFIACEDCIAKGDGKVFCKDQCRLALEKVAA
jgi:UPF0176 protein